MFGLSCVGVGFASSTAYAKGVEVLAKGALSQGGATVRWDPNGVIVVAQKRVRWQTVEHAVYRPEYLPASRSFLVVTQAGDGQYHVTVLDRAAKMRCRLEITGAVAGMPPVMPSADTVSFADPGVLARAPIANESNPTWLEARQQVNIVNYAIKGGQFRWMARELSVGQPLAGSSPYLWTVRLTNAAQAYGGKHAVYEIEQVSTSSGKIVRSWGYPGDGNDLTAFRWQADIRGTTCVLHRLEPLPDATLSGNTAPDDVSLSHIVRSVKSKRLPLRKLSRVAQKLR